MLYSIGLMMMFLRLSFLDYWYKNGGVNYLGYE